MSSGSSLINYLNILCRIVSAPVKVENAEIIRRFLLLKYVDNKKSYQKTVSRQCVFMLFRNLILKF